MKLITLAVTFFLFIEANAQLTFVILRPAGAVTSSTSRVEGGQQVGAVALTQGGGAALWTGSTGSYINLNPAWATSSSALTGLGGISRDRVSEMDAATSRERCSKPERCRPVEIG